MFFATELNNALSYNFTAECGVSISVWSSCNADATFFNTFFPFMYGGFANQCVYTLTHLMYVPKQ